MKKDYKFTIFTPCYNSENFIQRVFFSLKNQTYKNFEWLLIDDCSIDKTFEIISEYKNQADFPVRIIKNKKNLGLISNINTSILEAQGEIWVGFGHDDEIEPHTLMVFNNLFNKYNTENIASIYALAKDPRGKLVGKYYPKDELISDYWTQFFVNENEFEKFQCFKIQVLREFYPIAFEGKSELPPSWLWGKIGGKYKSIFINEILRTYYDDNQNSISKSVNRKKNAHIQYNYYTFWVNEFQYYIKGNFKRRLRGIGGYVSYGLLSKLNFFEIMKPINSSTNRLIILLFYPIAFLFNKRKHA